MTHILLRIHSIFKIFSEIKCYYPLLKTKKMGHKNDVTSVQDVELCE